MSFAFDVNNIGGANGGAEVVFDLKTLLKAAGWDVPSSGDGTTHFSSSDGITLAGAGAGGMNNSRAWFRIRAPASMSPRREFCFQRGSGGNTAWWIKVSAEDGFIGGTPDADDMPTATDETNLHGSTTAGTALFSVAASYKYHCGADNAAPFAWYALACTNTTGLPEACVVFEPIASGTFPSADQDPALYYARLDATNGCFFFETLRSLTTSPLGWFKKDLAGEAFVRMPAHVYVSATEIAIPTNIANNPYDADDNHFPIPYARNATDFGSEVGWKGMGTIMRWVGVTRSNMDTLSEAGVRTRVCVGDVVIPWPDVTPVL